MVNFIKGGLEDLCVSRTTFTWGVPVPFAPGHVVYVWLDALVNYLTAIGYVDGPERFARYWPADVHVVGKEIVRFHSVIWPAVLMSLGLPLPKCVFGHGWWTVEGEKMSKSKGNVIKPKEYADEFGVDALRYFVLREAPFGQDADFSRMSFIYRVNADLANDLGNLLSRTTAMINKFAGGVIPEAGECSDMDRAIPELAGEAIEKAADAFDRLDFQEGMDQFFRLVRAANKYVDEAAPWALARTDEGRRRLGTVLYNLAESLRIAAVALSPVLTRKATEIWAQLGLSGEPSAAGWDATRWGGVAAGVRIRRGEPVFPRFETKAEVASVSAGKPADSPADEPAGKPADGPTTPEPGLIEIEDFARVDLRVATILEAERVSGSDKLVKIQVDLGQERRQIVAGIARHYSPEELVGKQVVVVANLKPAILRGEVSNGMLLAASTAKDPRELSVLTLDRPIPPGSKVK